MSFAYTTSVRHPEAHVNSDIPQPISSVQTTVPHISSEVSVRSQPSTTGNVINGGSAFIFLPGGYGNQFIKSGSVYLNFNVAVTTGITGGTYTFNGPLQDASSLISRVQLSLPGASQNIQFFNILSQAITLNKTNSNYYTSDHQAMCGAGQTFTNTTAFTTTYNVSVLLGGLGLLSSVDSYLPLCLISGQVQIIIDFTSNLYSAFTCSAGQTITSYNVSNIQLQYTCVAPEMSYVNELRRLMKEEGFVYSFSAQDVLMIALPDGTSFDNTVSLNNRSLCEVHYLQYTIPSGSFAATPAYFRADQQTQANFYCDNRQIIASLNQDITQRQSMVYCTNKQGWNDFADSSMSYALAPSSDAAPVCGNNTASNYVAKYFCGSIPLTAYNEAGLMMQGTPCGTSRIQLNKLVTVAGSSMYVIYVRDCIYTITGDGMVECHM